MEVNKQTNRQKRLKQLKNIILIAIVSTFLNIIFLIGGVFFFGSFTELQNSYVSNNEIFEERSIWLESYISQLSYEKNLLEDEVEVLKAQLKKQQDNADNTGNKIAYLTFDDGPSNLTPKVLDVLDEYNVKATFFVKGYSIKNNQATLLRIKESGHSIGNHSVSHDYAAIYTSLDKLKAEILDNNRRIYEVTGEEVTLFRFPGGSSNSLFTTYSDEPLNNWLQLIHDLNMEYYDWNVSSLDATYDKTASDIYNAVINGCKNKNEVMILMHDVNKNTNTLEALPRIIEKLMEMGYSIQPITSETTPIKHREIK